MDNQKRTPKIGRISSKPRHSGQSHFDHDFSSLKLTADAAHVAEKLLTCTDSKLQQLIATRSPAEQQHLLDFVATTGRFFKQDFGMNRRQIRQILLILNNALFHHLQKTPKPLDRTNSVAIFLKTVLVKVIDDLGTDQFTEWAKKIEELLAISF